MACVTGRNISPVGSGLAGEEAGTFSIDID
jgi:hypothetical protein